MSFHIDKLKCDNLSWTTRVDREPQAQLIGDPCFVKSLNLMVTREKKLQTDSEDANWILYIDVNPILQIGPTCGIVALSIIANLARPTSVSEVLSLAQSRGYTNHGEMFSALNMFLLAKLTIGHFCDVCLYKRFMLSDSADAVWDKIRSKEILLVPYDKDKDNGPGLYGGHRAHWCVITGCGTVNGIKFYCGVQGKSRKVALWETELLACSNKQLCDINPEIKNTNDMVCCAVQDELAGYIIGFKFKDTIELPVVTALNVQAEIHKLIKLGSNGEC